MSQDKKHNTSKKTTFTCAKDAVAASLNDIEQLYQARGIVSGLTTGFPTLDHMTDGMHPGQLILIASRQSVGKTTLAMNIVEHVAIEAGKPVAVFSLDIPTSLLMQRMICSLARVNLASIRNGLIKESDFPALTEAGAKWAKAGLLIDETRALTIEELAVRLRSCVTDHGIKLAVIDFLELLRPAPHEVSERRDVHFTALLTQIKDLAVELGIPIIVLSDLNPSDANSREEALECPRLWELRESARIERPADLVILLFRAEYYAVRKKELKAVAGKATAIIAKQRNGPTGDIRLRFEKKFTRFSELKETVKEGRKRQ